MKKEKKLDEGGGEKITKQEFIQVDVYPPPEDSGMGGV